jgi:hypothetical protein
VIVVGPQNILCMTHSYSKTQATTDDDPCCSAAKTVTVIVLAIPSPFMPHFSPF